MKYFEKLAADFKTTKKLLKEIKSSGIILNRTKGGSYMDMLSTPGEIGIAKGIKLESPRYALFHEYGHYLDSKNLKQFAQKGQKTDNALRNSLKEGKIDKKTFNKKIRALYEYAGRKELGYERSANTNAIDYMLKNKVDKNLIEDYKKKTGFVYSSRKREFYDQLKHGHNSENSIKYINLPKHLTGSSEPSTFKELIKNTRETSKYVKTSPGFENRLKRNSDVFRTLSYNKKG